MFIPASRYEAAVDLYYQRGDYPPTTDGVEDPPRPGVIRGGEDGVSTDMRTDRSTAITALMQAKEPYGSPAHKFILLASVLEKESPAVQEKMDRLRKARDQRFSYLFVDSNNKPSPLWVVDMVHDTGGGEDADHSGRLSDTKTRAVHDGCVFGGAQSGGSGRRGAARIVEVGSAEDERVRTEAADPTHVECTMALPLWEVVAIIARKDTLFEQGLWLFGNTIGIAKVGSKVYLVMTTPKMPRSGDPWTSSPSRATTGTVVGLPLPFVPCCAVPCCAVRPVQTINTAIADLSEATLAHTAHQRTIDSGRKPLRGNVNYTPEERGDTKSTNQLKVEGARTATVRGKKATVSEAAWEGRAAPTPLEKEAMDQILADSSRGGINSCTGGNQTGKPYNSGAGAASFEGP
eukprot:g12519.t1